MSSLDRTINIYQGYSLAKICALNKKSLEIQYAQCEQIGILEKKLSRELQTVNRLNKKIIENQLRTLKQQESIHFYRKLAFKAKEAIELIESQNDLMFRAFLIKLYSKPLSLVLQDACDNLVEISDMEFCSKWNKRLNDCINTVQQESNQFLQSDYHRFLSEQKSYFNELENLENREKDYKRAVSQIKPIEQESTVSLSKYKNSGCFIATTIIALFCFLVFGVNISSGDSDIFPLVIVFLIIPLLVLCFMGYRAYKRGKLYPQYVMEVDRRNADKLEEYNKSLNNVFREGEIIAQKFLDLDATHPYILAKNAICSYNSNFENVIDKINGLMPQEPDSNKN